MSTDALFYGSIPLTPSVDGNIPAGAVIASDGCCPAPLCPDPCVQACGFVDLLPSGPMWDQHKAQARYSIMQGTDGEMCPTDPGNPTPCTTMVSYAVYASQVLFDMVSNILWPSVREANPATAVDTLDDWLDRLGWQDCYRTYCRSYSVAELSPYYTDQGCEELEYCPPDIPDDLDCALKHATLMALVRAQRGVIKNVDGINWVIAPLGARIEPRQPYPDNVQDYIDGNCDNEGNVPCFCDEIEFEICNVGDTLPACPSLTANCDNHAHDPVEAFFDYECEGNDAVTIYPGVLTAECIVRSLLKQKCPNIVFRCSQIVTPAGPLGPIIE